jgi:hypothetical protein
MNQVVVDSVHHILIIFFSALNERAFPRMMLFQLYQAVEKRFWVSLRAKRSNLVVNHFKHYGIASSLALLAMTDKEAFFNSLLTRKIQLFRR